MSKWNRVANIDLLKSDVLEIGDGYRAKNSEFDISGLPFARAGNINNGFLFDDADFLCTKSVIKAGSKISQPNDCVITTKGTFGRVAFVRNETRKFVYSPQLCYWRSQNNDVLVSRFLFYWLQGPDFLAQAFQIKSSTDMADYANLSDQRAMSMALPSVPIQKKIAAILSAYDELIENNNRRIAILEKMAEEIYKEWFVRLRFPGHEKVKIAKGIPEGWGVKPLTEFIDFERGVEPGSNNYQEFEIDDNVPFIRVGDLSKRESDIFVNTYITKNKIANKDDLLISMDGTVGLVKFGLEGCFSSGIRKILLHNLPKWYVYLLLKSFTIQSVISQHATGSTILHASSSIKHLYFIYSGKRLLNDFAQHVSPIFESIIKLQTKNQNLKHTRDRLLPRLISGKLDIENLNISFPPGMRETSLTTELEVAHA